MTLSLIPICCWKHYVWTTTPSISFFSGSVKLALPQQGCLLALLSASHSSQLSKKLHPEVLSFHPCTYFFLNWLTMSVYKCHSKNFFLRKRRKGPEVWGAPLCLSVKHGNNRDSSANFFHNQLKFYFFPNGLTKTICFLFHSGNSIKSTYWEYV